jgi:hypothetical protein
LPSDFWFRRIFRPELTTAISDKTRGEAYVKAFIENGGGTRMPNFHFSKEQTEALVDYLKYVDENAFSYKTLHQMKLKNNIIGSWFIIIAIFSLF